MKRSLMMAVATLLAAQGTHAQGQWFQVNLNCNYNPGIATCTIQNTGNMPMFCALRADGHLANGQFIYSYFNDFVPPGQFRYVYVYSSPPAPPLVGALGNGQCRF